MPPKTRFKKEDILNVSFEIVKKEGIENLNSRYIAKTIGSTITPIFSSYKNMDELKKEIYNLAKKEFDKYLIESLNYYPSMKEFALRWIKFAKENSNLYKLIFANKNDDIVMPKQLFSEFEHLFNPLINELENIYRINQKDAIQIINHCVFYLNGIAMFIIDENNDIDIIELNDSISEMFFGILSVIKIENNNFNLEDIKEFVEHRDFVPQRKGNQ